MFDWIALVQILVIVVLLWMFYRSFIHNTSSERLVRGLLGLGGVMGGQFYIDVGASGFAGGVFTLDGIVFVY